MPDTAELVRRDGVELIRTGSWQISTGRWDASREDLAHAVAALRCPAVRKPVIWIGHQDQRFTPRPGVNANSGDGEPGVGWVENLRLADGGHTLVGDYVGMPAWLGQVLASAYPDRSIEGAYNRRCQLGHTHPFVLDGVALLGVTRPGVGTLRSLQSLDDVRDLYGLAAAVLPQDGEVLISASIPAVAAAAEKQTGAMVALIPTEADAERLAVEGGEPADQLHVTLAYLGDAVDLSAEARQDVIDAVSSAVNGAPVVQHELVRSANWQASAKGDLMPNPQPVDADRVRDAWNRQAPTDQWIVEVHPDHAIVCSEADRSFARVPVTVDGDTVSFGAPEQVRPGYVAAETVTASAVYASRDESRPPGDPGPAPEPTPPPAVQPDPQPDTDDPPTPAEPEADPELPAAEPEPETETDPDEEDPVSTLSTDVRARLGLPEDADDAAVLAALDGVQAKAANPPTPEPDPTQVAAAAEQAEKLTALETKVELLTEQLTAASQELADSRAQKAADEKDRVLAAARRDGKIKPADVDKWSDRYDKTPDVVTEVLASIPVGTAVPVNPQGFTDSGETGDVGDEFDRLFSTPSKGA